MAMVTYVLHRGQPLTDEQRERLEALKQMSDDDIVYDEDCPKLTEEQLAQFKRVNPLPKKVAS
jgi:succinate dehydrogenase flavin-adding protein (antitoxin of CptAB toxin-antitoxin module)